ncbi:MAG: bis-aminopropyl spermidine synthase family protein [Bacteroidetes bacterium]|nr:bis-aminopropyl spermidine synthase family protein [Bacteroidota bacterium]
MKISCILICCDSDIEKGSSVYHSISAILKQTLRHFELVIAINNSPKSSLSKIKIKAFAESINAQRDTPIKINLISLGGKRNVNTIRNYSAAKANGELLVFVEDDTILLNNNTLKVILRNSSKYDFGFGAKRLWTNLNWFQKNSKALLSKMKSEDYTDFYTNIGTIPKEYKDISDGNLFEIIQGHTFIANFGFVKKALFQKVGGFPRYRGLDLSDDCLMYRLMCQSQRYLILNKISVVHVSHFRKRLNNPVNLKAYFDELISNNHYWCHTYELFKPKKFQKNKIIEPLKSLHYDYRLCEMYEDYLKLAPLNLKSSSKEFKIWQEKSQVTLSDFARLVHLLISSANFDEFIKESEGDFDNLATIIETVIKHSIIEITKSGKITKKHFREVYPKIHLIEPKTPIPPNSKLNQFPCTNKSRLKRANLILERYPLVEYMRFGIIGDDDLISILFKNQSIYLPVVIEKDERIINAINDSKIYTTHQIDLLSEQNPISESIERVSTFITDPPYTLNGSALFIFHGLRLLELDQEEKEFYVILNPMMMGKNLNRLLDILHQSNIHLHEVRKNFSQYLLPNNYREKRRAQDFLSKHFGQPEMTTYSSSSNLYIFRTINPDINTLRSALNNTDIYNHNPCS